MHYIVTENTALNKTVFQMRLLGDTSSIHRAGQFVQIMVPGHYLRRPISICHWDHESVTLIYKTVGSGTQAMSTWEQGTAVDALAGLGNGFDLPATVTQPLLVGGGVGLPPLYGLAIELRKHGVEAKFLAGFNTQSDVFLIDQLKADGFSVLVTTMDGSVGRQGLVTDALSDLSYDYVYCCGPLPMMRAVYETTNASGQFSFEERMGCGFGACMGCTIRTRDGWKRVCKDGPVLRREEILWQ